MRYPWKLIMEKLTTEQQHVKLIEFSIENKRSIVLTQRAYTRHFGVRKPPYKQTILSLFRRFQIQGSVSDLSCAGRPRSGRSQDNIQRVRRSIKEEPSTSTRRRSQQLEMSRTSLQRIQGMLHAYPYKIQLVQELKPTDYRNRLAYAVQIQELARQEADCIHNLVMGDEAHFHLNGFVNKQNMRFWGTENPRIVHQRSLHPVKVTVWCGVTAGKVLGPYFFEDEAENALTITGERYREMLENFVRPAVLDTPEVWWQQDGATAHTARLTIELLRQIFGRRIISRNFEITWPPRSPDLTAPDFFLYGYLKDRVYRNNPRTIQQLKANIREEIEGISQETLRQVMIHALERARQCEEQNGGYLKDVIFKTK